MRSKYMLIIAFCWLSVTITTAQIDQKPIGFWQFDEGKGDQAADASGNKFQGKMIGNPKWVEGKVGKALQFDGAKAYVEVADIKTPPVLTFACWFKKTGKGNGGVPRIHSSGGGPWTLEYGIGNTHQPGKLGFYLAFQDGGGATGWKMFFTPEEGSWYHTAITFDGKMVRTYVNGEQKFESDTWKGKKINSHISRIGAHASGGDCFDGAIDQVVMFEVALSKKEIQSLHDGTWLVQTSVDAKGKLASNWGRIKSLE